MANSWWGDPDPVSSTRTTMANDWWGDPDPVTPTQHQLDAQYWEREAQAWKTYANKWIKYGRAVRKERDELREPPALSITPTMTVTIEPTEPPAPVTVTVASQQLASQPLRTTPVTTIVSIAPSGYEVAKPPGHLPTSRREQGTVASTPTNPPKQRPRAHKSATAKPQSPRICRVCQAPLPSRNALFTHLQATNHFNRSLKSTPVNLTSSSVKSTTGLPPSPRNRLTPPYTPGQLANPSSARPVTIDCPEQSTPVTVDCAEQSTPVTIDCPEQSIPSQLTETLQPSVKQASQPVNASVDCTTRWVSPPNQQLAVPDPRRQPTTPSSARLDCSTQSSPRQLTAPQSTPSQSTAQSTFSLFFKKLPEGQHSSPATDRSVKPSTGWTAPAKNALTAPSTLGEPSTGWQTTCSDDGTVIGTAADSTEPHEPTESIERTVKPVKSSHNCQTCGLRFQSRNRLFDHLQAEQHTRPPTAKNSRSNKSRMINNTRAGIANSMREEFGRLEALFMQLASMVTATAGG